MREVVGKLVVATLLCLAPLGRCVGQVTFGQAYLSMSPDHHDGQGNVHARELFQFFLVLELDVPTGSQFELGACEGALVFDPSLFIASTDWTGANLLIGDGLMSGRYDFIVGWCCDRMLHDGANVLAQFTGLVLEATSQALVTIERNRACWVPDCTPFRWLARDDSPTGSTIYRAEVDQLSAPLVLTAGMVADATGSWGQVKALYGTDAVR